MPARLKRYYGADHLHFITCSCYHRQPWLGSAARRDRFLRVVEQVRPHYIFVVVGYVVMPEHIHLLMSEPENGDPSRVMQAIKQGFARRVLRQKARRRVWAQQKLCARGPEHVWQHRFYDFNVWSERKRIEKLRYMHRKSGPAWTGPGTRAVGVEQFSELLLRRSRNGAHQPVERFKDEDANCGRLSASFPTFAKAQRWATRRLVLRGNPMRFSHRHKIPSLLSTVEPKRQGVLSEIAIFHQLQRKSKATVGSIDSENKTWQGENPTPHRTVTLVISPEDVLSHSSDSLLSCELASNVFKKRDL